MSQMNQYPPPFHPGGFSGYGGIGMPSHSEYLGGMGLPPPNSFSMPGDEGQTSLDGTMIKVKGLPYKANQNDLYNFFSKLKIRPNGVQLQIQHDGRPSGLAFVAFETSEEATQALKLDHSVFNKEAYGDRFIRILPLQPADEMDVSGLLKFIGRAIGDHSAMGGAQFRDRGSQFTERLGGFPDRMGGFTGPPPGPPPPGPLPPQTSSYEPAPFYHTSPAQTHVSPVQTPFSHIAPVPVQRRGPAPFVAVDTNSSVVKVRNLPYSSREADIAAFFSSFDVIDHGIHLVWKEEGKISGEAYVEMRSAQEASRVAREMDRKTFGPTFGNRFVLLTQVAHAEMVDAMSHSSSAGAIVTPSRSVDPSADMHIHGYLKIKGLPFKATEEDIQQFFAGFQVVPMGVRIILQEDERPSGMAFVELESGAEANRARAKDRGVFNEGKFGDRFVQVTVVTRAEVDATLALGGRGMTVIAGPMAGPPAYEMEQKRRRFD
eukprot:CAMPEP_0198204106 /NCGR_PEP_ID=MMETSP1445-20131203/7481_1 /TAXON_ID=36898 /ORGANISM="Pyramimonas sp., Strain CCMP2087" /LENGTH=487 /DNA_ID=CAMNT_0043875823 /DNA_START=198 /DNA_END=1661 /DNA_ORIENTATION=-